MKERRVMPRSAVRFLVQHQSNPDESFEVDYATDLSRGGLFINTRKPLPPQSTVHVQFAPAKDARLVSAFCRVTHATPSGVGAQFISLDADSAQLLDAALS
ncbi:MAG: hypothetical protein AMXMBFR34_53030 [Myxococcaceae bacterium]